MTVFRRVSFPIHTPAGLFRIVMQSVMMQDIFLTLTRTPADALGVIRYNYVLFFSYISLAFKK